MRITGKLGFIKNFLFTLIICSSLSLTASCQTKVQTAAELVKSCQTFLDKDDLEGASECYEKLLFANPKRAGEISKASAEAIYQKYYDLKKKTTKKRSFVLKV